MDEGGIAQPIEVYSTSNLTSLSPSLKEHSPLQCNTTTAGRVQNSVSWVTFFLLFSIIQMILGEGEFNTKHQVHERLFMDMDIWNEIHFSLSKQQI